MNTKKFMKRLVHLPLIGNFIGRQLLRFYKPNATVPVYERVGGYGERMYFEPLAETRDTSDWMFKVYTSERAKERDGLVTTIWMERVEISHRFMNKEQLERFIEQQFKMCRDKYNAYMQENLQSHQWEAVANGKSFMVNASGSVAYTSGIEKPLDEVEEKVVKDELVTAPS